VVVVERPVVVAEGPVRMFKKRVYGGMQIEVEMPPYAFW
jgi:hypothetical protein